MNSSSSDLDRELEKDLLTAAKYPAGKPLTAKDLEEAMQLLKFDMHLEMQSIIREQVRQFTINKVYTNDYVLFCAHILMCEICSLMNYRSVYLS